MHIKNSESSGLLFWSNLIQEAEVIENGIVSLTFNFKVTGGLLKVRFWPFSHILAQFSLTGR